MVKQLQDPLFNAEFELLSVQSFARSPHVFMGFLCVPWFPLMSENM